MTEWRKHPTLPIMVSDQGDVRSIERPNQRRPGWTIKSRSFKRRVSTEGYLVFEVEGTECRTHVVVLEAFVGPRPSGHEALHLDANRANASLSNLKWGTRSENQLQRVADGHHHLANKTHCKRGHLLVTPNLRPQGLKEGKRQCQACQLGLQWARLHPGADIQASCDRYYTLI